jgi:kojibiose phosphorylase
MSEQTDTTTLPDEPTATAAPVSARKGALGRVFPVIVFAWEGTAVADRDADAGGLRSRVERLAALGVDLAVVSRTGVQAIDGQLRARPGVEGRFFMLVSRGSEVYAVGPGGPRLQQRRRETPAEDQRLTAAAEGLRSWLAEQGVAAEVLGERLNRRKVDLLPGVEESPAADVRELLPVLRERLAPHGLSLGQIVAEAERIAQEAGVARARVTSDVQTVDIGLTDKSDSLRWVVRYLVVERGRDPSDVLVLGDQFGPVGEVQGSDEGMLIPELRRATFVSVGDEPEGVPEQVLHAGGGVAESLRILDEQIALRERVAWQGFPEPTPDESWRFEVAGFDPFREREVEAWMTIANGATGTRGSLEEGSAASTPATYVAGVFGDGTAEPRIRQPVPAPDWLCLRLLVHGTPLNLANGELLEHKRVLDMRQGLVFRYWRQRDRSGRIVRVRTARFASLADKPIMAVRAEATLENFSGRLVWEGCLGVSHAGGPVADAAIESLDGSGFIARTRGRRGGGHVLAVATTPAPGSPVSRHLEMYRDVIGGELQVEEPATIDRLATVASSPRRVPPESKARRALQQAGSVGYDELLDRHREVWERRWRDADVAIVGDSRAQLAVRFSAYHMISTAFPEDDDVSIGARGLSGTSYFGHVFWDTEIFVVPFFIYTYPEAARTMLAYRFHRLDQARAKAVRFGHKGALFPWESADTGEEATPPYGLGPDGQVVPILSGILEHHISADVAWATWEYWKATGDDRFMLAMGAEMILETARFWVSRTSHDEEGHHHIRLVVGPDEYHESVDDNAYTNVLARWNIRRGLDTSAWLTAEHPGRAAELRRKLRLTDKELHDWRLVADDMIDGFDPKTKLYEQFAGFFKLDDVDPERLRPRPMPADLLLGRELVQRSKVVKQADVVMMNYLLADEIPHDVVRANFDYYGPITVHGSSLSPGIHAAVGARLGDTEAALENFRIACDVDLSDNMGNAARGLHMATMGALWQAAVKGFGGVRRKDDALVIDPHLPPGWQKLRFPLRFRGARVLVEAEREALRITIEDAPAAVVLGRRRRVFRPGVHLYGKGLGGTWKETP